MQITDISQFIDYYQSVRTRTRRLLPLVPPEQWEWTYQPGKFTIGDLVRHMATIERFLYVETLFGRPSQYTGCGPELANGYEATIAFFDRCHAETLDMLRGLTPEHYGLEVAATAARTRNSPPRPAIHLPEYARHRDPTALRPDFGDGHPKGG